MDNYDIENPRFNMDFRTEIEKRSIDMNSPAWSIIRQFREDGFSITIRQNPNEQKRLGIVHTIVYQGRM